MPGLAHEAAHIYWNANVFVALAQLTPPPHGMPPGCVGIGATSMFDKTHNLSLGSPFLSLSAWIKKEAGRCCHLS